MGTEPGKEKIDRLAQIIDREPRQSPIIPDMSQMLALLNLKPLNYIEKRFRTPLAIPDLTQTLADLESVSQNVVKAMRLLAGRSTATQNDVTISMSGDGKTISVVDTTTPGAIPHSIPIYPGESDLPTFITNFTFGWSLSTFEKGRSWIHAGSTP